MTLNQPYTGGGDMDGRFYCLCEFCKYYKKPFDVTPCRGCTIDYQEYYNFDLDWVTLIAEMFNVSRTRAKSMYHLLLDDYKFHKMLDDVRGDNK